MTVEELVRAAAAGNEDAFAELVQLYQDKVYTLALRMCENPDDAIDVSQDAFLAAWKGLPNFRGDSNFATWLYRLTSNAAIDHLRRTKHQRGERSLEDEALTVAGGPDPHAEAEASELRQAVESALQRLTPDHRQALVLREIHELSYEEISQTAGVDLGTVKSRISRARKALRKILQEEGNLFGRPSSKKTQRERRDGHGPV